MYTCQTRGLPGLVNKHKLTFLHHDGDNDGGDGDDSDSGGESKH